MLRPLILAVALFAPAAALAQPEPPAPLPPASAAPSAAAPPAVSGEGAGMGRYGRGAASPEMRQARQAMMQACSADFAKFCADAPAGGGEGGGGGGRMQCIRQHASELSDGCRSSMQAMRAARQGAPATPPAAPPPG